MCLFLAVRAFGDSVGEKAICDNRLEMQDETVKKKDGDHEALYAILNSKREILHHFLPKIEMLTTIMLQLPESNGIENSHLIERANESAR